MIPEFFHVRFILRLGGVIAALCVIIYLSAVATVIMNFDGTSPEYPVDCAIVFGAAVGKGSTPGPGINRRVQTAAELYKKNYVKKIIMSGGKGSEWVESEAEVMRKVGMLEGINPEDILLEDKSRSTWENIKYSKPLLESGVYDCTAKVGISDRYHLARISLLARKQGIDGFDTHPASVKAPFAFEMMSVLREALGVIYYIIN
ncbi:MAG: YdcF family protein [Candidatus Peribacteraceae bacterium]|jgi:uncharacterized SAM-binding protein YcdF (DUF218 family)|nr:YdcF family protein [Candidatus Peribacteraceae bacterium]|tara:strand:- start:2990 stop:3598 length:609 start_codon:yes stop_codon:yes gene_type:complete